MRDQKQHIAIVDGLRGYAILLVMLFHFWQISWWVIPVPFSDGRLSLEFIQVAGGLGVELFFFLSAFCLCYPHAKTMIENTSLPSLTHYTYRRAIKILPSYFLAILLILLLLPDLYPTSAERGYWTDILMHLGFIHNLFPDTQYTINGVFWSLGVEIQFYVLFPVLAWLFRRRPWLAFALLCAAAISYRMWTRMLPMDEFIHWNNQLPGFLDLFAAGMLSAYLLVLLRQAPLGRLKIGINLIAALSIVCVLLLFDSLNQHRGAPNGYPIWQSYYRPALALILITLTVASSFAHPLFRKLLANRALIFLSLISYNLYLWHQIIARVLKEHGWLAASTPNPTDDPTWRWSMFLASFVLSILIATIITYGFERPLLHYGVKGCWQRIKQRAKGMLAQINPIKA
ncbi:acyltransferase [Deefgea tanakiae]|uniref:Acyltransferase n=1 Tax=Deefgea tanakiae TaxID=2865840 RepID=A0ABX8Z6X9_9NEIS|nr:acyltransferase [Deefgea tanakiae]QZA76808.1 acyltransferase [Deefgea tanakiae]